MFEDRCYDRDNTINTNFTGDNMNIDMDVEMNNTMMNNNMMNNTTMMSGMTQAPIMSPVQERCIHKTIVHEVPQDCQFMLYTKYGMNLHT